MKQFNAAQRLLLTAGVVLVAVAVVAVKYWDYIVNPWTRDGQVRAQVIEITPRISGPIVNLPIEDNQFVNTGDLLFEIDPRTFAADLDQKRAELDKTRDDIEALEKQVEAAKASVSQYDAIVAQYEESIARSRAVMDTVESLDQTSVRERDGEPFTVRWILVHLIEEYARHCGHADLIREAVDGTTGD